MGERYLGIGSGNGSEGSGNEGPGNRNEDSGGRMILGGGGDAANKDMLSIGREAFRLIGRQSAQVDRERQRQERRPDSDDSKREHDDGVRVALWRPQCNIG